MNAREITSHLRRLCADIDAGRSPRRFASAGIIAKAAVPAVIGLSTFGLAGCPAPQTTPVTPMVVEPQPVVVVQPPVVVEPQPVVVEPQPVALYAAPSPVREDCQDNVDNDGDGSVDCSDAECVDFELCQAVAEYAVPFEPREICNDNVDNDHDGAIDCADSDCGCAIALYAAPPPAAPPPQRVPRPENRPLYGVPF